MRWCNTVQTQPLKSSVFKRKYEIERACDGKFSVRWPRPEWKKPWKLQSHLGTPGWVRSVAGQIEQWFATVQSRCIKIWDLATGGLKHFD